MFNGFQDKKKIAFVRKDEAIYEAKIQQSLQQFEYQINAAENDLATATAQLKSTTENLNYMEEYYREIKSRYDQCMVLLVELNDAFTQFINGRLNFELSNTTVLIKKAEVERASASYLF